MSRVSVTSLSAQYPEVAKRWHPTKNGRQTPHDVGPHSGKKAWWKCSVDKTHVWQAIIQAVTKSKLEGCPFCKGLRVSESKSNSLAIRFPAIAHDWHNAKNEELTAFDVTPGSNRKVWWQCPLDATHEYECKVSERSGGRTCPYCRIEKPLSETHPQLVREWCSQKNEMSPAEFGAGSRNSVWWKCDKAAKHVWRARIEQRALAGQGCPFCAKTGFSISNSLRKNNPKLAREWHPIKNGGLLPDDVNASSSKKVWWQCKEVSSHEWAAAISDRTNGAGCPYCTSRLICDQNRLSILFPEIASEWHPTKNGELKADAVVAGSAKTVWWLCGKSAHHAWQAKVETRTRMGNGCPFCAGLLITVDNSLKYHYPEVALLWHKTRNGKLTPADVAPRSNKKAWWKCPVGHVWQAPITNVVRARIVYTANGCRKCVYIERSAQSAQSLKSRAKANRKRELAEFHEELEGVPKPVDPTVLPPKGDRAGYQIQNTSVVDNYTISIQLET